jgi:hypothetical protein
MSLTFRSEEISAPRSASGSQKTCSESACDLPVSVGLFVLPCSLVNMFIDDFRHLLAMAAMLADGPDSNFHAHGPGPKVTLISLIANLQASRAARGEMQQDLFNSRASG